MTDNNDGWDITTNLGATALAGALSMNQCEVDGQRRQERAGGVAVGGRRAARPLPPAADLTEPPVRPAQSRAARSAGRSAANHSCRRS